LKYEVFFSDEKYIYENNTIKVLINNLIKIFEDKCTKEFYPKWRGNEGDTKVFAIKLNKKLSSIYGQARINIVTVRMGSSQLNVEVYNGTYCNGKEFCYDLNISESNLKKLYTDINSLYISKIINE
jgi:hypothetical protein